MDWKDTLESSDDVAYEKWGYYWRMPRREEFRELLDNCSLEFTKMEEVFGILFQSKKNGNSIFLPVAGAHLVTVYASDMFMYWSSSLDKTDTEKAYSLFVNFNSDLVFKGFDRDCGMSVRPVADYDPDVRRQLKENVRKLKEEYGF